jgi:hypothetical protein
MGILDGFFGGGQGGGVLPSGFGEKLRDLAPIMSAIGNNQDIGAAQFRVQQMQARRQQQQEEEFQKQAATVLAQKMGLPPELASNPESVFSLARSMKLAEEARKNREPERLSVTDQWMQKYQRDDPEGFQKFMENGGMAGAARGSRAIGPDGRPLTPAQEIAQAKFQQQQEAAQKQQQMRDGIKQEGADVMRDTTADTVDAVEKGRLTIPGTDYGVSTTTGILGSVMRYLPATEARKVAGNLDTIKGSVAFGKLAEMREASKTGGALGQVAVQELNLLQATLGSLDQATDEATFLKRLKEVEARYARLNQIADQMGVQGGSAAPPPAAGGGGTRRRYDAQGNRIP